ETMPFYASQFAPAYRAYNYGIPGYGTQQMLARLQSDKIDQEVNEKNGILIYVFIDHHVKRVIGSSETIWWAASWPYYTLDASDNLVRKGSFTSGRPFLSLLYYLLSKSQIATYFHVNLPREIDDNDIKLTAKIIERSRNIFRDKFKNSDFYVLFMPGSQLVGKFIPHFEAAGIKYLD